MLRSGLQIVMLPKGGSLHNKYALKVFSLASARNTGLSQDVWEHGRIQTSIGFCVFVRLHTPQIKYKQSHKF